MEVKIAAGAMIDVASSGEVDGIVGGHMGRLRDYLASQSPNSTIFRQASQQHTSGSGYATQPVVLDCGGPSTGKTWDIRRAILSTSAPWGAAEAAPVVCFVSAAPAGSDLTKPFPFEQSVDYGSTSPVAFNYGRGSLVLEFPEHYYVTVLATASGHSYWAAIRGVESDRPSIRAMRP
jgi:hypothetical protein